MSSSKNDTDPMPSRAEPGSLADGTNDPTDPGPPPSLGEGDALRDDILRNMSGTPRVFSPVPEEKATSDGAAFAAYRGSHALPRAHAGAPGESDGPAVVVDVTQPDLATLVDRARTSKEAHDATTTQPPTVPAQHGAPRLARGYRTKVFLGTLACVLAGGLSAIWLTSPTSPPIRPPPLVAAEASRAALPTLAAPAASPVVSTLAVSPAASEASPRASALALTSSMTKPPELAPAPPMSAPRHASAPTSRGSSRPPAPPSATPARPKPPAEYDLLVP